MPVQKFSGEKKPGFSEEAGLLGAGATVASPRAVWDTHGMNTQSQQLLQSALALPEADRAEIAVSLIHSLDEEPNEDVDAAWAAETKRRIKSIDNGEVMGRRDPPNA